VAPWSASWRITPLSIPSLIWEKEGFIMVNIFSGIKLGNYREKQLDISVSAFEIFKRLYPYCKNIFLLESLGIEGKYNRYSYIGFNPLFTISARNKELIVNGKIRKVENPYLFLSSFSSLLKSDPDHHGYSGGLVGYISYEATRYFEPAFVGFEHSGFPDFEFGLFLDGLRFDKKTKKCVYFYRGVSKLSNIIAHINQKSTLSLFSFKKIGVNKSREEHKEIVLNTLEHIKAGDIFQAVLSVKTYYQLLGDKRRIYAALRQINPSPYMFYFKFGQKEIITASPELLIKVEGKHIEHFGTLAGTIGRGVNEDEDKELARVLGHDEKERAEHLMMVDLARNDLGKICEFESIRVDKLAAVRKYSHVQHLYTEVSGKLKETKDAFSALSACFPAGTLTGAPKIEAMKIITGLEGEARGPYGGVGGYFSLNGDSMLAITIRSIFVNGEQGYTQTGSGIVLDSSPEKEYQEILNKQKAIEEALRLAAPDSG